MVPLFLTCPDQVQGSQDSGELGNKKRNAKCNVKAAVPKSSSPKKLLTRRDASRSGQRRAPGGSRDKRPFGRIWRNLHAIQAEDFSPRTTHYAKPRRRRRCCAGSFPARIRSPAGLQRRLTVLHLAFPHCHQCRSHEASQEGSESGDL